ncbi:hypothetical protein MTsPCn5_16990 [Croceitalea sp. MTPC5]|uniref:Uncharacterized protein n=1 Tax=Croceitalea marina TaxID=1775166 RepID=A0ABW5MX31_9FLAO|nr:hypothetical protein MTsPCn5_16990 [Croceitalea sp. MTPC5]
MIKKYKIVSDKVDIILEEAASYQSIETVRKEFVENEGNTDTYVKIFEDENEKIIEFRPISELSEDYFLNFIESKEFGIIPETQGFLTSLKTQSPFERILLILAHIVKLNEPRKLYHKAHALIIEEINYRIHTKQKYYNKKFQHVNLEESINICEAFIRGYFFDINVELQSSIQLFKSMNLLNSVEYLVDSNLSVINQNDDCLMLSPILFNYEQWKKLLSRELMLIDHSKLVKGYAQKFIALIKELENRLNYNRFPLIENYFSGYSIDDGEYYKSTYNAYYGIEGYTNKISDYSDFISGLPLDNIEKLNQKNLASRIVEDEKRKEVILQKLKNSKIRILRNISHVKKGFKYLLKKSNLDLSSEIIDSSANQLIIELFHTSTEKVGQPIPDTVNLSNQTMLEFLLLLEKHEYIKYNPKVSIPKIIANNCSLKSKGMTQSNLYHILKKLSYNPDNIQSIKLSFQGLTSEIALLNEMKN